MELAGTLMIIGLAMNLWFFWRALKGSWDIGENLGDAAGRPEVRNDPRYREGLRAFSRCLSGMVLGSVLFWLGVAIAIFNDRLRG